MSSLGNFQTSNPAFGNTIFDDWAHAEKRSTAMTVQGTAGKALALLLITTATATASWVYTDQGALGQGVAFTAALFGFVFAMVTCFKPTWAPVTAPIYAALEGVFLGSFSNVVNKYYPGLPFQAVSLTFGASFVMFTLYATGLIKVTGKVAAMIGAATGALCLFFLFSMLASLVGFNGGTNFINSTSKFGIAFSVFVVGLAAFNLLLDFDFIEKSAATRRRSRWSGTARSA